MLFFPLWTKLKILSIVKGWCSMDLFQQHDISWYSSLPPFAVPYLHIFFKMKCRLSHSSHSFVHPVVQTASQQTWRTPSTRTSTSRSTWSLRWPASYCLQTCTAGPAASSWRATLPSRCWATTASSRRWLSAASTSPTRRGWSPRGTFEKGLCKWWGRFLLFFFRFIYLHCWNLCWNGF